MKRIRTSLLSLTFGTALVTLITGSITSFDSAYALTCRQQFNAAKKNGTLNGMDYQAFKAASCKEEKETNSKNTAKEETKENTTAKEKSTLTTTTVSGDAVFPDAISSKYEKEKLGKARMHTCLDQYHANKESGKNGNLKWIQKGGGYYSECLKHLKGNEQKK